MTSAPGYIVAEVTVHDAETYDQYVERSGADALAAAEKEADA